MNHLFQLFSFRRFSLFFQVEEIVGKIFQVPFLALFLSSLIGRFPFQISQAEATGVKEAPSDWEILGQKKGGFHQKELENRAFNTFIAAILQKDPQVQESLYQQTIHLYQLVLPCIQASQD